jgi:hypothetical protein
MTSTQQVNKSNEEEIKKLYLLSKPEPGELEFRVDGSIWKNGKLIAERPTEDQEQWANRRMRGSARSWEVWDQK